MDIDAVERHIRRLVDFEAWARPFLEELLALKEAAKAEVDALLEPEPETPVNSDPAQQPEGEEQQTPEANVSDPGGEELAKTDAPAPEAETPAQEQAAESAPVAEEVPAEAAPQPETAPSV